MTKVREVIERFYERFGAGDLVNAFACFAPDCIAVGLSGPMNNDEHMAAARRLKSAMPDCHMGLIRTLEAGDEIYVTGRFKGPTRTISRRRSGPSWRRARPWSSCSWTTSAWRTARSSNVKSYETGWA